MKRIIIVRHGEYNHFHKGLDELGRQQIDGLGKSLKPIINGESVKIISSTAKRAKQSAQILADMFKVKFKGYKSLWSGPGSPRDKGVSPEEIVRIIQGIKSENLIMVTHLEYSEELPQFIRGTILDGIGNGFPSHETEKGEAWVIDCEAKTCDLVRPKFK